MEKRRSLSINGTGKIGQSHAKECNWTIILHYIQKFTQNKDLNIRPEIIKLQQENIGGKFFEVSLGDFLIFKNFLILFFNIFIGV